MKNSILLFLFLANSILFAQEAWRPLGPDDFTDSPIDNATYAPHLDLSVSHEYFIDIAIDSNNVPYIVYQDGTNEDKITVRKFNSTFWEVVGTEGFSAGQASDPRLAIDSNNVPYVAYIDAANADKATLQKFNGTAWEVVGTAGFSAGAVYNMNLEIDANNVPYVGLTDSGIGFWPIVWRFNGTEMEMMDTLDLQANSGEFTVMALDSDNNPYLAYYDPIFSGTQARKWNNDGFWEWLILDPLTPSITPGSPSYGLQMAIDANNVPYVLYLDTSSPTDILRVTIIKYNGTTWELVGTDGISGSYVYNTDIAIDANNVPYVAYEDGPSNEVRKATVQKFNGTAWEVVGSAGFSEGTATDITIAIGANNVPYVVYMRDGGIYVKYFGTENTLSTNDNEFSSTKTTIYPNPVASTFSISGKEFVEEIAIYDVMGKKVLSEKPVSQTINIEHLSKGMYLAKIKTANGTTAVKLLKE
jgi:hypothetical protein